MARGTRTEVVIAGKKYAIMSDDNSDYLIKIAKCVNNSISEMISSSRSLNVEGAAVLTALKYCDDVHKLKDKKNDDDRLMKQIISYSDELSKMSQENKNLKKIIENYERNLKK